MPKYTNHTGETQMMNCGMKATIINCPNSHNLTIQFEDGFIKTNVYYGDFKRGLVRHNAPKSLQKTVRLGEVKQMNNGALGTIIEYINSEEIIVSFPNGRVVKSDYDRFNQGLLTDGRKKTWNKPKKEFPFFQTIYSKNGYKYEIIQKLENGRYIIRFENGKEKEYSKDTLYRNIVFPPSEPRQPLRQKKYNIGDIITNENNLSFKILDINCPKYTVQFSNGVVVTTRMGNLLRRKYLSKNDQKQESISNIIGETNYSLNRELGTIIGGTSRKNLTIQFEDGTTKNGISYYNFKKGNFSNLFNHAIRTDRHKKERLGLSKVSKNGTRGTIVEYINCTNITVQLETGELINTDFHHFQKGLFTSKNERILLNTSLNEYTLLYCLEQYGFIKGMRGSLKKYGLQQKELDLFHPQYLIGIEYDGPTHQSTLIRDIEKDKICENNGIKIIRIRESCDILNDNIAIELTLNDSHNFSPALQKCLNNLCSILSDMTNSSILPINILEHKDKIIESYSQNINYKKRIGETTSNIDGLKMTIIKYRNSGSIDVEFENGYIALNKSYFCFKNGKIKCKFCHYGEESISKMGELMVVVSTSYGNRVDVQFPNGYIAKNQLYCDFQNGRIANKTLNYHNRYIGESTLCRNGRIAKIINAYPGKRKATKVDCVFEDGTIVKGIELSHFKQGYIKYPLPNRVGETQINNQGQKVTVINYRKGTDIDVKFEDGTIKEHVNYYDFKRGYMPHPSLIKKAI